jgi:hypothetical protein
LFVLAAFRVGLLLLRRGVNAARKVPDLKSLKARFFGMGIEDSPSLSYRVLVIARPENLDPCDMTVTYEEAPHSLLSAMNFCAVNFVPTRNDWSSLTTFARTARSAPGSGAKFAIDERTQYML